MFRSADLITAVEQHLASVDVDSLDGPSLHEGCGTVARVRGMLDAFEARLLGRNRELHAQGAAPAPDETLARAGHVSGREARRTAARAETVAAVPELGVALADGKVSAGHADALTRIAGRLDTGTRQRLLAEGPLLAGAAGRLSPESFERHCKRIADSLGDGGLGEFERQRRQTRLRHWIDGESGLYMIHAALDPETGTRVFASLDTEIERLWHSDNGDGIVEELARSNEHLAAHALAERVHRGHTHAGAGPVTTEVSVLIDHRTLIDGLHDHGVCELTDGTTIPVETARRLACDAGIVPIVLGGGSVPLDVGRARRLATRAQRQALRAMYRTCAFDGCDIAFSRCQPHHLREWDHDDGPTDLANLLPLCHRHHHLVHEGRWQLSLDAHRTLTITRPDGTLHALVPINCAIAA